MKTFFKPKINLSKMDWTKFDIESNYSGSVRNKGKNFGGANRLSFKSRRPRGATKPRDKTLHNPPTTTSARKKSRSQRFPLSTRRNLDDEDCVVLCPQSNIPSRQEVETAIQKSYEQLQNLEMAQRENYRQIDHTLQHKRRLGTDFDRLMGENDHICTVGAKLMKDWDWERSCARDSYVQKAITHNDQRGMENRYHRNEILDQLGQFDLYQSHLNIFGEHLRKTISSVQQQLNLLWSRLPHRG